MTNDPVSILRTLAKQFKGRVSSTSVYDANICSWTHPANRSWEFNLISGEPFSKQLQYIYRRHKIRMFANRSFLNVEVASPLPIEPLSVNRKNKNDLLLKAAQVLTIKNRQYSSFTRSGELSPAHRELFARDGLIKLVQELDLQADESLHIAPDGIKIYFDSPSILKISGVMESLVTLAEAIEREQEEIDFSVLPVQFHTLIPLMKKWAIGDDSDREDFLINLPKPDLQSFVSEVDPFLGAIDSYLNSFGHRPPSEEAAALGRLAECVIEAKQHLKTG